MSDVMLLIINVTVQNSKQFTRQGPSRIVVLSSTSLRPAQSASVRLPQFYPRRFYCLQVPETFWESTRGIYPRDNQ